MHLFGINVMLDNCGLNLNMYIINYDVVSQWAT